MGPAEVWRMVEAGGGAAEMTVRELRDAFGVARLTARARETIAAELEALGLHVEPPLDGLDLAARVRVVDAFVRAPAPAGPPPRPVAPVPPAPRSGSRLWRTAAAVAVAAALLMAVAAAAIVRSGGGPPPVPPGAAAAATRSAVAAAASAVVTAGPGTVRVVRLARYRTARRLGRQGRFLEARAAMLTLGPFRNAPAAARSYSVRAGQAMLAEARRIRTRRPARARALVWDAGRIAPGLSSLPRVRALVRSGR